MQLEELKESLEKDISKSLVSANVILRRFHVIDEMARDTILCTDNTYFPFYYHLGKYIEPESLLEIGFGTGLVSGTFMSTCSSVRQLYAFDKDSSWRLGRTNVLNVNPNLSKYNFTMSLGNFKSIVSDISKQQWNLIFMNEIMEYDALRRPPGGPERRLP